MAMSILISQMNMSSLILLIALLKEQSITKIEMCLRRSMPALL